MAVELEGLEFQIEAKSNEAIKGVDALSSTFSKLKKVTKGGLGLNSSVKQLTNLNKALEGFHSEKLEKLSNALGSLSGAKSTIPSTLPKRISELGTSLQNLREEDIDRLERVSNVLHGMGDLSNVRIPRVNVPTTGVAPTMTTPGNTATDANTSGLEQSASHINQTTSALDRLKSVATGFDSVVGISYPFKQLGQTLSSIPAKIKKIVGHLHELYSGFKKSGGMVGAFSRMMGNIFKKSAAGMAAGVKAVTSSLGKHLFPTTKKTTGALGKLLGAFKRISLYRAIRFMLSQITQALKEGINNLYQYSNAMGGTFAQSMDRLATSSQYLKNSLGAMAAPIINALAPAIDFVIDKIATLLNYINMLFARLSGASVFTAAKKSAASYGDSLSSAGGSAAQAAKEIRDATTGIDELNMIMAKDNSGGGGGGSGTDYGSMFEELPIDSSVSDFADKLKEAFENADWEGLGTILGTKFNEIIDSVNWNSVGSKLGFGLNGAIQTVYYTLKTIDFNNVGVHLAELLNSALEQVDTSFIGRTIVRWFTLKLDFIIGGLSEFDWGQLARKFCDLVKGALDEVTEWLNSYDWSSMGETLWTNIKNVVSNIDWNGTFTSLATTLGTALRSALQFVSGFISGIGADIKNWFDEEITGTNFVEVGANVLKAIGNGFTDLGTWVWNSIINPFMQALLGEKWDELKETGRNILTSIKNGWDASKRNPKNIGQFIVKVKNDATTWWKNTKDWWGDKVEEVKKFPTNVVNNASQWWNNTKMWWSGKVGKVQEFWTNVKNQAGTWWNNVSTWWSGKVGKAKEFWTWVTNNSSQWWSDVKSWWSGKCGKVAEFWTKVRDDSGTWWNNVSTWWANKRSTLWSTVGVQFSASDWWNKVKKWWSNAAGSLTTTLNVKTPHIKVNWGTVTAFGKSFSYPEGFDLEWYAKGGILDGAQIFGMMGNKFLGGGEAGREAVLPLESHTEWMDTLAEKVRSGLPEDDHGTEGYYNGVQKILEHMETLERTMNNMANDMNRQANKKEQTTVQIGNRIVTDAVTTQQNANGYRFTK